MLVSNLIGVVADDLTGANDTALQFFIRGCNTRILLNYEYFGSGMNPQTQVWAISVETRNKDEKTAYERTKIAALNLKENFNAEYFYKKIDSTLRGNIAVEIIAMLEALKVDCAIVAPAFPNEGRITIGGFHLLKSVPLERTELARDPHFPIYESHIPSLLAYQLGPNLENTVALIDFRTVVKGAGPILMKIKELVSEGKKIIVLDAQNSTDLEQIALAVQKSSAKILPCGSAGLAQALGKTWLPDFVNQHIKIQVPHLPKFIVSGSATQLTASQIEKLKQKNDDILFIPLKFEDVFSANIAGKISRVVESLKKNKTVVVHTSELVENEETFQNFLEKNEISKEDFISKICNYLANLTKEVVDVCETILILIGGETSYKCCEAINSEDLQVIDEVTQAIPLCLDHKSQWIVTKSGNLGNANTLIDILNYFERH